MVDKQDFRQELAETANKICTPGKGILAADESEGTIGKKFLTIGVENTADNRRKYRQILFDAPIEQYISGVITFKETCTHSFVGGPHDGKKFVDVLRSRGVYVGIKVDAGVQNLPNTKEETSTKGLDGLAKMCADHYAIGCRFAKWRSVLKIDPQTGCPTEQAIHENAWQLARYAAICQENGLVPIVEPEILSDGNHDIAHCQKVTEKVLAACFKALNDNNVFLEGCLLKPNMVTPGSQHPTRKTCTAQEIATRTVIALQRTVPPALVGVVFLSGGMSEEEASFNLDAMNRLQTRRPWALSFSYGRALQNTCVKTWDGKDENIEKAKAALLLRAKCNSEAQLGKFTGSGDKNASESLFVEGYKY